MLQAELVQLTRIMELRYAEYPSACSWFCQFYFPVDLDEADYDILIWLYY